MGFGLWKKIKNGLHKVWGGMKKAGEFVYRNVVKPLAPVILPAAGKLIGGAVDTVIPGAGSIIQGVANAGAVLSASSQAADTRQKQLQVLDTGQKLQPRLVGDLMPLIAQRLKRPA
jgi:hypothetical protein